MMSEGRYMDGGQPGRWRLAIWGGAALLLLLPLVAMQFTPEVDWGPGDFLIFGAMLAVAAGIVDLAARLSGSLLYRAGVGLAVAGAFLLVWVNLAVGIIGNEGNPANLIYCLVLAIGGIGAVLARFRAEGMAGALTAVAVAQILAGAFAMVVWRSETILLDAIFACLWLVSAGLFRNAALQDD